MCLSIIDLVSLGLICLCSGYVHLYICKKKMKNDKNLMNEKKRKKKHMCMCMVFSIFERVYWYSMVILSSIFVGESSYVSFLRSSLFCIHFVTSFVREWDEWLSPKGSGSLSLPSLHSLLMWLHSMFDLSWSSLFFRIFIVSLSSSSLLLIHPLCFTLLLFSYIDLF